MAQTVSCTNCGKVLDEDPIADPKKRKPCPNCGSKARDLSMIGEGGILISGSGTVEFYSGVLSTVNLLLQTVVVSGSKTEEGQIIEAVALPWFEIIDFLKNDPSAAFQISWRKWEEIVAGAYKRAGFEKVILTPSSGDYGRDIIAEKKGLGYIRIIDQVKAYKPDRFVSANDVRALMGVLHNDGASKGFLTTTSDFAPKIREDPLITPFIPSRLELINGQILFKRLEELVQKKKE